MLESMFTAAGAVPGWAMLSKPMMTTNDSSAEVGGFRLIRNQRLLFNPIEMI